MADDAKATKPPEPSRWQWLAVELAILAAFVALQYGWWQEAEYGYHGTLNPNPALGPLYFFARDDVHVAAKHRHPALGAKLLTPVLVCWLACLLRPSRTSTKIMAVTMAMWILAGCVAIVSKLNLP